MISDKTIAITLSAVFTKLNGEKIIGEEKERLIKCLEKISYGILTPSEKELVEKYPELVKYQNNCGYIPGVVYELSSILNLDKKIDLEDIKMYSWKMTDKLRNCLDVCNFEIKKFPKILAGNVTSETNLYLIDKLKEHEDLRIELKDNLIKFIKQYNSIAHVLNETIDYLRKLEGLNNLKSDYPELYNLYKDERDRN